MIGKHVAHYRVDEKIGEGGMGEVYLAEDTSLERKVALKFLPLHLQRDPTATKRFQREARSAAALDHPYICKIYEAGKTDDDLDFIVMEYVEGQTLQARLAEGPLPLKEALKIGVEVAEALEKAHGYGIVHRDLKPANIMLTPEGHAKVMDFGLAKKVVCEPGTDEDITSALTREGSTLGTLAYMSPEQIRAQPLDHRSDIFSFGIVLYELLSGVHPFRRTGQAETIGSILQENPPPVSSHTREASPLLEHVLRKLLTKDPDRRYQLSHDVRVDLMALVENSDRDLLVPTGQPLSRATVIQKSRAVPFLLSGLIGLIVGLASVGILYWIAAPSAEPTDRNLQFVIDLPDLLEVPTGRSRIVLSPDGGRLVFQARDDHGRRLYVRALDKIGSVAIPGTENGSYPFFSPDGEWVGFFDGKLVKKVSVSGDTLVTLCEASRTRRGFSGGAWRADGTIFLTEQGLPRLWKVSENGGEPEIVKQAQAEEGTMRYYSPQVLPGTESVVLFTITTGGGDVTQKIALLDLITGERRILIEEARHGTYASSGHLVYRLGTSLMAAPFDLERLEVMSEPVAVLQGVDESFTISTNGRLAYIQGADPRFSSVVWMDRQGNREALPLQARGYWEPSLSPDNRYLAVSSAGRLMETWLFDLARGTMAPFTLEGSNHITVWTPDGKRIVFSSDREGPHNLFWKSVDGSDTAERLSDSDWHQDPASWTPDGKVLAFAQNHPESGWDIVLLRIEGERREEIFLQTEFDEGHPMISPDGKWIAYTSNESGTLEVYVQPFPAGGRKWLISTGGGTRPLWSPDGRELYYFEGVQLMAVPVLPEAEFAAGNPQLLAAVQRPAAAGFGRPGYDITSDGNRFIVAEFEPSPELAEIHVVLNWFEELKRLVPTE